MSETWETYPTSVGDKIAFVTYDHGIADDIDDLERPFCLHVRLALREANAHGLPGPDEAARLNAIEDDLNARLEELGTDNVGRLSSDGRRSIFFYTQAESSACDAVLAAASREHGYELEFVHQEDPGREGYWHALYPDEEEWQIIQDMRIEEQLREHGDPLTEPRPIEHWCYFPTEAHRSAFVAAVGDGYEVVELVHRADEFTDDEDDEGGDPDGPAFGVRLEHTGLPDHRSIEPFTRALRAAAEAQEGEYDGWGTEACAAGAP